jgi:hypothetical protein
MKPLPYHVVHSKLGHMGEDAKRKAAKYLGFPITAGTSSPCISCSEIKVKKRFSRKPPTSLVGPLSKSSNDAKAPIGTRFYLDVASVRISQGFQMTKPNFRMLVEGAHSCLQEERSGGRNLPTAACLPTPRVFGV